jgi:hypothetical protein
MKKLLIVAAAVISLVAVRASFACTSDAECGVGQHCGCSEAAPAPPAGPPSNACGAIDLVQTLVPGSATVLEISGCADPSPAANGCVSLIVVGGAGEAINIQSGSGTPPAPNPQASDAACDARADQACVACGCGTCVANED